MKIPFRRRWTAVHFCIIASVMVGPSRALAAVQHCNIASMQELFLWNFKTSLSQAIADAMTGEGIAQDAANVHVLAKLSSTSSERARLQWGAEILTRQGTSLKLRCRTGEGSLSYATDLVFYLEVVKRNLISRSGKVVGQRCVVVPSYSRLQYSESRLNVRNPATHINVFDLGRALAGRQKSSQGWAGRISELATVGADLVAAE